MKIKRIFLTKILFSVFLLIFLAWPAAARDNVSDWYIKDYQARIVVNSDSSLNVYEWITADCGTAINKHGIFRQLPLAYHIDGKKVNTKISDLVVSNFDNRPYKFERSVRGDDLIVKIGDPNITVQGENYYYISYRVTNAIRWDQNNTPELYWNILGPSWDLEIDNFKAQIIFPEGYNYQTEEVIYYDGQVGEKNIGLFSAQWIDDRTWQLNSKSIIQPGQGLTISSTLTPNLVVKNNDNFSSIISDMLIVIIVNILIIITAFIALFWLWKKYGQDPKGSKTVVAEFEAPNNLGPLAISGVILSGGVSMRAVTATIIRFAVAGYLKIEASQSKMKLAPTHYSFIRTTKVPGDDLTLAEKYFLDKLFSGQVEVSLSSLNNKLAPYVKKTKNLVLQELDDKKIVYKKSYTASVIMMVIGANIVFVFFHLFTFFFSVPIVGILLVIFGFLMPKRSAEGAELYRRILGFKLYLTTAEKYRSQFYEKENMLEVLLPYAILFGLTKKWLRSMQHIYGSDYSNNYQPSFISGSAAVVGLDNLMSSMNSFSSSISSKSYSSASGRGGGGFSGGGGGGGGGGGW